MKKLTFWKSLFLLCALIVGSSSAWADDETVTLTSQQIKAGSPTSSTSYTDCSATDGDGNTWTAYAMKNQHSNNTSTYHYWQIKKYVSSTSTAYYVKVPTLGSKIKSLKITVSSTQKARDGGSNGATLYFSSLNSTSAAGAGVVSGTGASSVTIDCSSLNLNTGYITSSGAVRIWDVEVTYETSSEPAIISEDVNVAFNVTSGYLTYTLQNATDENLTATKTVGDWISNVTLDKTNKKVTFNTTINNGTEAREGTIQLAIGDLKKDVTITQEVGYSVTYSSAQENGTLTIKNGDDVVASGTKFPVGTVLTIVTTPDENYAFHNWQYKKGTGSWVSNTSATTYTIDENNVEFRANFDPTYAVNFSINGQVVSTSRYAEGKKITFPESVTPFENFTFVGWAEAAIDGSVTDAPTLVDTSNETMGNADKTYYAVYGENNKSIATATFDASDITNLTAATTTKTWTDNATGIQMYISNGDRYTGTPNAWNVTKSTSNNDYYMSIGRAKCAIKKVVITVTGSDYAFGDYYAYTYTSDETGTDLTSDVTSSNNVYTWQLQNDYEQVILWSGYSYQVRATKIVVDAEMDVVKGYMTTIPTTGTITLNAACTDGNVIYGTYYTNRAYEMPENVVGQVVSVDNDGKLVVEDAYNPGDVVPAYTALLLYTIDDFTGTKDYTITYSTGGTDLSDYNMLKGTLTADDETTGDNCLFYRLTMHKGTTIGFYWGAENGAAFKPGANKAYLAVPAAQAAKMFGFAFDSTTTGINGVEEIAPVTKTRKVVKNGRLVIETANGEFTIDGARMK